MSLCYIYYMRDNHNAAVYRTAKNHAEDKSPLEAINGQHAPMQTIIIAPGLSLHKITYKVIKLFFQSSFIA